MKIYEFSSFKFFIENCSECSPSQFISGKFSIFFFIFHYRTFIYSTWKLDRRLSPIKCRSWWLPSARMDFKHEFETLLFSWFSIDFSQINACGGGGGGQWKAALRWFGAWALGTIVHYEGKYVPAANTINYNNVLFSFLWLALGLVVGLSWLHGIRTVSCFSTNQYRPVDTVSSTKFSKSMLPLFINLIFISLSSIYLHLPSLDCYLPHIGYHTPHPLYFSMTPGHNSQHNRNYMFPFVGLMKLSFISCFLIAIGVSIAIVIHPLSNELQGAWIVSIMGTGLYRIHQNQWQKKNPSQFQFNRFCFFSFMQYFSGILRLLCTHYISQWRWWWTTINRIWCPKWTTNMRWMKMWFKHVLSMQSSSCCHIKLQPLFEPSVVNRFIYGHFYNEKNVFSFCSNCVRIHHVEFDTSAMNLSINGKSFKKSLSIDFFTT